MTTRNLEHLFRPRSVALIGASAKPRSVGAVVARNLVQGGFAGPVQFVNPRQADIEGRPSYRAVADLPSPPDLAVIATPPASVPGLIAELAAAGTRAAVVITAGFGEDRQAAGKALQQAMLDAARPSLLRIVGPNCLGILNPHCGLNASFAHSAPVKGPLAFVAQSGAVIASVMDWATPRGIGFSHVASLGDMADVDFGDMLDFLAQDGETRAVLLYVEMITNPRKFMSAARAAARIKPVVVVKAGRHDEGARAAASHTGALAGSDLVYDAAFRRAGMLRVLDLGELFSAVQTLSCGFRPNGDRLAILTNGGGMGVLATDRLIDEGGSLAVLSDATLARLDGALPRTWSHGNPVDIIGDADGPRYGAALTALLDAPEVDAVLVLNCPTAVASSTDAARAVVDVAASRDQRPAILTSWVGAAAVAEARAIMAAHGVPSYETPEEAVQAFMQVVRYRRNQRMLMEAPSARDRGPPDMARAQHIIETACTAGQAWLPLAQTLELLRCYGIPAVASRTVASLAEVAARAAELTAPLALKILSSDIQHKSDVQGVALDLADASAASAAATTMLARVQALRPEARIDGFLLQEMVRRPHAQELIVGLAEDRQFGPVVLFGHGGTATEVIGDRAIGLPPLNSVLARDLIGRTRVSRLLHGYRDRPAADLAQVADVIVRVGQLAVDFAAIVELDINPLLADEAGVIALDARVRLKPGGRSSSLAIQPYPRGLEGVAVLSSGERVALRPVRPEDAAALGALFAHCRAEDLYLRFLSGLRRLDELAARLTQIDYEREIAFVALGEGADRAAILGIVHLVATPDLDSAEFGVIVRSDMKGHGLGYALMTRILAYAAERGVQEVYGHVLRGNEKMLQMSRELGFTATSPAGDGSLLRVSRVFGATSA